MQKQDKSSNIKQQPVSNVIVCYTVTIFSKYGNENKLFSIDQKLNYFIILFSVNSMDVCRDKLSNCSKYSKSACEGSFSEWGFENCQAYCGDV